MNCPHCDIEISEHPASRCLDEWIAETVFHYHRPPALRKEIPHYSTSIAAAWEVVEKMGFSIWCVGGPNVWTWGAGYWDWEDGKQDLLVYVLADTPAEERLSPICDTAPLAICRAAIKATMRANP